MAKTRKVRHAFRGSMRQLRLGPEDGVRRHPDERGVTLRDRGGNKLIDVVNPHTGFCVGVRSPMSSDGEIVRPARTVVPKKGRYSEMGDSGVPEKITRADKTVYVDFEGRVVRTCEMDDEALPVAYVNVRAAKEAAREEKRVAREQERAARQEQKLLRAAQGCVETRSRVSAPRAPRVTRQQCLDFIRSKGYSGVVTEEMVKLARECLKANKAGKEAA
jgi:hypothetical protein